MLTISCCECFKRTLLFDAEVRIALDDHDNDLGVAFTCIHCGHRDAIGIGYEAVKQLKKDLGGTNG